MKRIIVAVSTMLAMIGLTLIATADAVHTDRATTLQDWTAWFLGSASGNPLDVPDGVCGELVGDQFFMYPGISKRVVTFDCEIPAGTELLFAQVGGFANTPTDGPSDIKLFADALGYFQGVVPNSISATLDGVAVPRGPAECIEAFDMPVEEGSLLLAIDDNVTTDSVRMAQCAWWYTVEPLPAGDHVLVFKARFKFQKKPAVLTVNATVL
jgi:hypothetical protein